MASVITDKGKLNAGMSATADAIRAKTGESAPIPWDYDGETGFAAAVEEIPTGREPVIEPLVITENGSYAVPAGVDGFGPIIVGVAVRSPRCDQVTTFDWGTEQQYMAWMDGVPSPRPEPTPPTPPTPSRNAWTSGTDEEVAVILDAAQAGTLDLQQNAGWHVGDVRTITVGSFTNSHGVTSQPKATRIVISSFEEYNGCGNVMQFDFVDETYWGTTMDEDPDFVGGYGDTDLYSVTIPALVEALPEWLKTRLLTFSVLTGSGGDEPTIVNVPGNKLAPRSEVEVFGTHQYSVEGEGAQLPYYQTVANRDKFMDDAVIGPIPMQYWFRSPTVGLAYSSQHFVFANGGWHVPYYPSHREAYSTTGFAPFGCL